MAWLGKFLGEKDPYENEVGVPRSEFFSEGSYRTTTACGYVVQYQLACHFQRTDDQAFKRSQMLSDGAGQRFLDVINRDVVLPMLNARGRAIRLTGDRPGYLALCPTREIEGETWVMCDKSCAELNEDLRIVQFTHFGCTKLSLNVKLIPQSQAEEIIEENYKRMIKLHDVTSIKNTPGYMATEEAVIVALAHRELELRKLFLHDQTDQIHNGTQLTIVTRANGHAVEIRWSFTKPLNSDEIMTGYRKEHGFCPAIQPLEQNGACIAHSRCDDSVIISLAANTEYFFTFAIARVNLDQKIMVDSVRFIIRVPSLDEIARVDAMVLDAKKSKDPKEPLSDKTKNALQELLTFVEFDENVSELERQLVARISSKDYSDEEKSEKIERLRDVVNSLRIDN